MKQTTSVFILFILLLSAAPTRAQYEGFVQEGEFGLQLGAAHYFGDLNTQTGLRQPGFTAGGFYRRQFNNYAALRIAANYARLGYSDRLQASNEFQQRRNLSFRTNIWELLLQGDFNFFRFNPTNPHQRFTPYLTFGAGVFYYDPFTELNGQRHFLRPLGTEGQFSAQYPERKPYGNTALTVPFGVGIKWALHPGMNLQLEVTHRFTGTDYLDDVSTTYAGLSAFDPGTPPFLLQDR
ncbi:MAG TPA: DUF6089 family protein, partial [Lacibacter sp.]|nr:DUF6089 family protein [Lacibacter sp.]